MPRRELARAFVLTVSTSLSLGCSSSPPHAHPGNPPTPHPPSPTPQGTGETPLSVPPAQRAGDANPKDASGRHIRRAYNGEGCFVYLDFPPLRPGEMRPPGSAPPTESVPCPPEMSDPAYDACRGGVVSFKDAACECFEPGNPPRVQPNPCPER